MIPQKLNTKVPNENFTVISKKDIYETILQCMDVVLYAESANIDGIYHPRISTRAEDTAIIYNLIAAFNYVEDVIILLSDINVINRYSCFGRVNICPRCGKNKLVKENVCFKCRSLSSLMYKNRQQNNTPHRLERLKLYAHLYNDAKMFFYYNGYKKTEINEKEVFYKYSCKYDSFYGAYIWDEREKELRSESSNFIYRNICLEWHRLNCGEMDKLRKLVKKRKIIADKAEYKAESITDKKKTIIERCKSFLLDG